MKKCSLEPPAISEAKTSGVKRTTVETLVATLIVVGQNSQPLFHFILASGKHQRLLPFRRIYCWPSTKELL